jgi:hypothetical protein
MSSLADIRGWNSLLIAALSAKGTSTIQNIEQIDRGYERIDERLRALGAKIIRKHNAISHKIKNRSPRICLTFFLYLDVFLIGLIQN